MTTTQKIIRGIRLKLSRGSRDAAWKLGWIDGLRKKREGERILIYHGLTKNDPFHLNTLFLRLKQFEQHLLFMKKYFQVVSLNDFFHQRFSKEKFTVSLSFDDGFANNYQYVLPLLEKYQLPATFFITAIREAGYDILWNDVLSIAHRYGPEKICIGNEVYRKAKDGKYQSPSGLPLSATLRTTGFDAKEEMIRQLSVYKEKVHPDYWLQMTEDQIRQLSASKWVTIGSHGYYHNDLAEISAAELKQEIISSKTYLENLTGREVSSLAFPYGSYNQQVISMAKKAGYKQLLATELNGSEERHESSLRERLTINPFLSTINQAHAILAGHYH